MDLRFIVFHRCAFYKLKVKTLHQQEKLLIAELWYLPFLQWFGTEPSISPRSACKQSSGGPSPSMQLFAVGTHTCWRKDTVHCRECFYFISSWLLVMIYPGFFSRANQWDKQREKRTWLTADLRKTPPLRIMVLKKPRAIKLPSFTMVGCPCTNSVYHQLS